MRWHEYSNQALARSFIGSKFCGTDLGTGWIESKIFETGPILDWTYSKIFGPGLTFCFGIFKITIIFFYQNTTLLNA